MIWLVASINSTRRWVMVFPSTVFSHFGTMEGWPWKALCNEAPFRFGKNLASSAIRTRDPWSEVGSANPLGHADASPQHWGDRQLQDTISTQNATHQQSLWHWSLGLYWSVTWEDKKQRFIWMYEAYHIDLQTFGSSTCSRTEKPAPLPIVHIVQAAL